MNASGPVRTAAHVPWLALATGLLTVSCSTDQTLEGFRCNAAGECAAGYICHPETSLCVPRIVVGCEGDTAICPSRVNTGDGCPSAGAFLPCADDAIACEAGCRTCAADSGWSACSSPCGELGQIEHCSSCSDDCTQLPHTRATTCDTTGSTPVCRVSQCEDGYVDLAADAVGCECEYHGVESCNGQDDDCNGTADDVANAGALRLECQTLYALALHVSTWRCAAGGCQIESCAESFRDADLIVENGCETVCTTSSPEVCNGQDDDCNGTLDDVSETTLATQCPTALTNAHNVESWSCGNSQCQVLTCTAGYADSNDVDSDGCESGCVPTIPATEVCDGLDNDCDGTVDNANAVGCSAFFRDVDRDDVGLTNDNRCLCAALAPYDATIGGDCDDDTSGCGAHCYPGNVDVDRCDGRDDNCDGADGEDDPALGTSCDGADTDRCLDDEFDTCVTGELRCSAGADSLENDATSCTDNLDNDCDGAKDCSDADCLGVPACSGFTDQDLDGVTNGGPTPDCDATLPTCTFDCLTNSDSAGEGGSSTRPVVVDCVESFCRSDPHDAASLCYVVDTATALNTAIVDSNTRAGAEHFLLNSDFTVSSALTGFASTNGGTLVQRPGKLVTITASGGTTRPFQLLGDHYLVSGLKLAYANASAVDRLINVPGSDNRLEHLNITASGPVYTTVWLAGARDEVYDLQITHTGTAGTTDELRIGGTSNSVDTVTTTYATGGTQHIALIEGPEAQLAHLTATTGGQVYYGFVTVNALGAALTDLHFTTTARVDNYVLEINANDVMIDGVVATLGATATALQAGLRISDTNAVDVRNVTMTLGSSTNFALETLGTRGHFEALAFSATAFLSYGVVVRASDNWFGDVSVTAGSTYRTPIWVGNTANNTVFEGLTVETVGETVDGGSPTDIDQQTGLTGTRVSDASFTHKATTVRTFYGIRIQSPDTTLDNVRLSYKARIDTPVHVTADRATLKDLTISYEGQVDQAIYLSSNQNTVRGCHITDALPGLPSATHGIYIQASNATNGDDNLIEDNHIAGFKTRGIHVYGSNGQYAERNRLVRNLISGGLDTQANDTGGIVLSWALDTRVVGNVIVQNSMDGIQVRNAKDAISDANRITYIDHNTVSGNEAALNFYYESSISTCVRNNSFSGNRGPALRYGLAGATTWANSAACVGSLTAGKWGNNQYGNGAACGTDAYCNVGSSCSCLGSLGMANFFEFNVDPTYASVDMNTSDYYCLSNAAAAALVDSGDVLVSVPTTDPLYEIYDRNGDADGTYNDTSGPAGAGPDIGARESGSNGCY